MPTHEITAESSARSATVQGLNINYHEAGEGTPLVMLHGGGPGASAWSNYHKNVPVLAEHFRVIAIDMPHFGKSDKPLDRYMDPVWYAEIVTELLHQIGVKKAHFVGNSMGGIISMELALTQPDLVDKVVLMGVPGAISVISSRPTEGEKHLIGYYAGDGPSREKLEAFVRIMIYDQALVTPELLETRYLASTVPELMVKRKLDPSVMINMWRRAEGINHKTLIIHGHQDRVVPWDAAMTLMRLIPNADFHVFGRCGHWAQTERAEDFNPLVLDFLSKQPAG